MSEEKERIEEKTDENMDGLDFEEALDRLEEINNRLEKNKVSLEKAIELYEEGMKLIEHCSDRLEEAEGEIKKLTDGEEVDIGDRLDI